MNFLKSKLLLVLVTLCMAGALFERAAGCCESHEIEHSSEAGAPAHSDEGACDCVCHHAFASPEPASRFQPLALTVLSLVLQRADIPPDAVPVGIDYPPQLS